MLACTNSCHHWTDFGSTQGKKKSRRIWFPYHGLSRVFCFSSWFRPLLHNCCSWFLVFLSGYVFWMGITKITSKLSSTEIQIQPSLPVQLVQFVVAMLAMDTWQYFMHRYMHQNKFLYRHVHSQHHKLVVPYAIGALYNHPLEGLLLDTFGGAISFLISGMTARTAVYFFCFAVVKTIDDHCGLCLPGNIFHIVFQNNTAYHDIHHQPQGTKFNYSQPFFSIWDRLLGTYMPYNLIAREEGGFEARPLKD